MHDLRASLLNKVSHRKRKLTQAFTAHSRYVKDLITAGFELWAHHVSHVLAIRNIDLVQCDDRRAVDQRDWCRLGSLKVCIGLIAFKLAQNNVEIGNRVSISLKGRTVENVHESSAALNVPQEFKAEPTPFSRAFDEARDVSDRIAHVAGLNHTKVRNQGSERIISDLWLCGRKCANQG